MTNWSSIEDFESMISQANNYTPFWTMMLLMIWSILVITFIPLGTTISIISGSFIAGIIGLFLVYMNVVSWKWVLAMFSLSLALVIWETFFQRKEY